MDRGAWWAHAWGHIQCMGSQTVEHEFAAKQQQTKLTSSSEHRHREPHLWVSKSNTHQNHLVGGSLLNSQLVHTPGFLIQHCWVRSQNA